MNCLVSLVVVLSAVCGICLAQIWHQGGSKHPLQIRRDFKQVQDFLHDVANEKIQLITRLNLLKDRKADLLERLQFVLNRTIPHFNQQQQHQDDRLHAIKMEIKEVLHNLADKEAILAGEQAKVDRLAAGAFERQVRIDAILANDIKQRATVEKIKFEGAAAKEKLFDKLDAEEDEAEGKINELLYKTEACATLVNYRKCLSLSAVVPVNGTGARVVDFPQNFFAGQVPTAFCAFTGFAASINLDDEEDKKKVDPHKDPHAGGYKSPSFKAEDEYSELGYSVDCKPVEGKIWINVVDSSLGEGNAINTAYVDIKVCTFGPQALPKHM